MCIGKIIICLMVNQEQCSIIYLSRFSFGSRYFIYVTLTEHFDDEFQCVHKLYVLCSMHSYNINV